MNELAKIRKELGMTQIEAAKVLNISRRNYQYREAEESSRAIDKLIEQLKQSGLYLDKEHGYISQRQIINTVKEVVAKYPFIHGVFLFGSYARNEQRPNSDIDLLIVDDIVGIKASSFYKELEKKLVKELDIVSYRQVKDPEFLKRILLEGIKIYG